MRGISSIISIVLLLMIVIAFTAAFFIFSSRMFVVTQNQASESLNTTSSRMQNCLKFESSSESNIYIRNCGPYMIINNSLGVYIDNSPVLYSIPRNMSPDEVGTITLMQTLTPGSHEIKVSGAGYDVIENVWISGGSMTTTSSSTSTSISTTTFTTTVQTTTTMTPVTTTIVVTTTTGPATTTTISPTTTIQTTTTSITTTSISTTTIQPTTTFATTTTRTTTTITPTTTVQPTTTISSSTTIPPTTTSSSTTTTRTTTSSSTTTYQTTTTTLFATTTTIDQRIGSCLRNTTLYSNCTQCIDGDPCDAKMPSNISSFDYSYGTCESGLCKKIQCVNMVYNGNSSQKLDILFIGDDYTTSSMSTFVSDSNSFSSRLLNYEPFNSTRNKINIYRINNTRNLGCYYNCAGIARLICCDTTATQRVAVACPYDEIIVIVNNNTYGGSGGWMAVSYRGNSAVAVHEFGHSFGGLPDHYNTDPSCANYHCMMCALSYVFGIPPPADDNCLQRLTTLMGAYQ